MISRSMVVSTLTADQTTVKVRSNRRILIGGQVLSNLPMGARMPRVRLPLSTLSPATVVDHGLGRTAIRHPRAAVIRMVLVIAVAPVHALVKLTAPDHERAAALLTGNLKGHIHFHITGMLLRLRRHHRSLARVHPQRLHHLRHPPPVHHPRSPKPKLGPYAPRHYRKVHSLPLRSACPRMIAILPL